MSRQTPRSTRTDPPFPYPTLFRSDGFGGDERHCLRFGVASGDDQVGDMLAGLDRRLDRAVIDDLDAHVAARDPRRNGDGDVARRDQADLVLAAELDPRVGALLPLGEERLLLPGAEAPNHHPGAFVHPLPTIFEA